jgi:hypothetical protein
MLESGKRNTYLTTTCWLPLVRLGPRRYVVVVALSPRRSSPRLRGAVVAEGPEVGIRNDYRSPVSVSESVPRQHGMRITVPPGVAETIQMPVDVASGEARRCGKWIVGRNTHTAVG